MHDVKVIPVEYIIHVEHRKHQSHNVKQKALKQLYEDL